MLSSDMTNYLVHAIEKMVEEKNTRDLGKLFAEPNEYIQRDWINKNTTLAVKKRDDSELDHDGTGYDLITCDGVMRIQSKLRATSLHLEQTRRNSQKNMNESSKTGHVKYKITETDIFLISRPLGYLANESYDNYLDSNTWKYIAIPTSAVEDPATPGYCYSNIPSKIWKKYIGNAEQTLIDVYNRLKYK